MVMIHVHETPQVRPNWCDEQAQRREAMRLKSKTMNGPKSMSHRVSS